MNIPKRLWRAFSGRRPALCSEPSAEPFWEPRFDKLARYNTEVAHGLMHTPAHKARMKTMQSEYDAKLMAQNH